MTVFKTFLKIVNRNKFIIIMYTVLLVFFAGFNVNNNDTNTSFVETKPDVVIINKDVNEGVTKNLIDYISKNSNVIDIKDEGDSINDALFYRDVNYIIYIPNNYRNDFLDKKNPTIQIKSTGDYQSSLAEMMLTRYINTANTYNNILNDENELMNKINETLDLDVNVNVVTKLDTTSLEKAVSYYNFLNYSIIAGLVYVICLVLLSFRNEKIRKRTIISSMNYKKMNRQLLISNSLLAIVLWGVYVVLSFALIGDIMKSSHGFILIVNSLVFTICALTISFLIANLIDSKNAVNGIINVIGLGSSFLCGAFVPVQWLPDAILKIAHVLPSYWYINANEIVKNIECINIQTVKPVIIDMFVVCAFSIGFIVLTNIVSKKKRKIA